MPDGSLGLIGGGHHLRDSFLNLCFGCGSDFFNLCFGCGSNFLNLFFGCGGRGLNGLLDLFNSSGHSGGNYRRFACFSGGYNRSFACLGSGGGCDGHLSGGLRGRFCRGDFCRRLSGGFGGHLSGGNIRNHNCLRSRRCFHRRRRCRFSGEIDADRGGNDQNDH